MDKLEIFRAIFYNPELTLRKIAELLRISPTIVSKTAKDLYFKGVFDITPVGRAYRIRINDVPETRMLLLASEARFTYEKVLEQPEIKNINKTGDIVVLYGSRASNYYTDFSDFDIFSGSVKKLKKLTGESLGEGIMKKHVVLKGFEKFMEVALEWRISSGALK